MRGYDKELAEQSCPEKDERYERNGRVEQGPTDQSSRNRNTEGAALLERRRFLKKSGILPNLPIAERGLRVRYRLHTISHHEEVTLYGSLRCCSQSGSG